MMIQNQKILEVMRYSIFIFLVLLCIYFFDQIVFPIYTRHGQEIIVPDLTNLFYEDARDKLSRMNLKIVEESKKFDMNNVFPIGVIMSQNPPPESKVKKGRRIYVIVSKGEPIIEMPDLTKRSERNAIFLLANKGLQLGEIHYDFTDLYPAGVVIDQSVPPGTEIKPGLMVDIVVSSGRFPDKFIVPNVVNRTLTEAKKIIFEAGLTLGSVSFEVREDLLPETVIVQSLQPNIEVFQADTINLLVSKLPSTNKENLD